MDQLRFSSSPSRRGRTGFFRAAQSAPHGAAGTGGAPQSRAAAGHCGLAGLAESDVGSRSNSGVAEGARTRNVARIIVERGGAALPAHSVAAGATRGVAARRAEG